MMMGIFVSSMNSDRGTPAPSRVPPELGIFIELPHSASTRCNFSNRSAARRSDDQHEDQGERERQHPGANGEGCRNTVREQFAGIKHAGSGGREHHDKDSEPKEAAELVGGVDQPGSRTGVLGGDASNARDGEWGK